MLYQEEGADGVLLLNGLMEQRQACGVALVDVGPSGKEGGSRLVQASPQGQAQHRLALRVLQVEVGHHPHVVWALLHLRCNHRSLQSGQVSAWSVLIIIMIISKAQMLKKLSALYKDHDGTGKLVNCICTKIKQTKQKLNIYTQSLSPSHTHTPCTHQIEHSWVGQSDTGWRNVSSEWIWK